MERRRKILLIAFSLVMVVIIVALSLTTIPQTPTVSETPPLLPSPNEIPPNILVTPEVPLGTIAIALACLLALLVAHNRSKNKLT